MFEELLIPREQIVIRRKSAGPAWKSKVGYFNFSKHPDTKKWSIDINPNIWKSPHIYQLTSASDQKIQDVQEFALKEENKSFPTLKQAHQTILNIFKQLLSENEYQAMNKEIIRDRNQYHEIMIPEFISKNKSSDLYFMGETGRWDLHFDSDEATYNQHSIFSDVFFQTFKSRPYGLNLLYENIGKYLNDLYFSTKDYTEKRNTMQEEKSWNWMNDDGWWMMFIRPEINLDNIFS